MLCMHSRWTIYFSFHSNINSSFCTVEHLEDQKKCTRIYATFRCCELFTFLVRRSESKHIIYMFFFFVNKTTSFACAWKPACCLTYLLFFCVASVALVVLLRMVRRCHAMRKGYQKKWNLNILYILTLWQSNDSQCAQEAKKTALKCVVDRYWGSFASCCYYYCCSIYW